MKGRTALLKPTADQTQFALLAVERLNAANCFDFAYTPIDGDLLIFHRSTGDMHLRYFDGTWEKSTRTTIKLGLEEIDRGTVRPV